MNSRQKSLLVCNSGNLTAVILPAFEEVKAWASIMALETLLDANGHLCVSRQCNANAFGYSYLIGQNYMIRGFLTNAGDAECPQGYGQITVSTADALARVVVSWLDTSAAHEPYQVHLHESEADTKYGHSINW